jgi:hypothetical protein
MQNPLAFSSASAFCSMADRPSAHKMNK